MVDVDQQIAILNALLGVAEPLQASGVQRNDAVEVLPVAWLFDKLISIEEDQLSRHIVIVPTRDFLTLVSQREGERELGTDAIPVWPDVSHDANGFAFPNALEDAANDPRGIFHVAGSERSNSAMISSTRLPRATNHRSRTASGACI